MADPSITDELRSPKIKLLGFEIRIVPNAGITVLGGKEKS